MHCFLLLRDPFFSLLLKNASPSVAHSSLRRYISSMKLSRISALLLMHLILVIKQSSAQEIHFIPDISEQVVSAGSNITLTCIFEDAVYKENSLLQAWQLPDYITKQPELSEARLRFSKTHVKNETHVIWTMTLANVETKDTGYFGCAVRLFRDFRPRDEHYEIKQYVYVSSNDLIFIDSQQGGVTNRSKWIFEEGSSSLVPCKPTHPNVTVSLIRNSRNLLSEPNSNWTMESKRGLTLTAAIEDAGDYQCIGTINNTSTEILFTIFVEGLELIEVHSATGPREGGNITLICRIYTNLKFASPPKWFFKPKIDKKTADVFINETKPPKGIQISSVSHNELGIYESRLELRKIDRYTTPREFKCKSEINNTILFKKISLQILGPDETWVFYAVLLPMFVMYVAAITIFLATQICCPTFCETCGLYFDGVLPCCQVCLECMMIIFSFN